MRTRSKEGSLVDVRRPSRHSTAFIDISTTHNGYQWFTLQLYTRKQAEKLHEKLGDFLQSTAKENFDET